jgi:type II secretory pathway predicted ATPase ExeA
MYRQRFGLTGHPIPKNAQGKTFFETPGYKKLARAFSSLEKDPGLSVLTAHAGVGKTAAIRNLCGQLPKPDHLVVYLCDTAVSPLDLYRMLAVELGVKPSHRRAQLWADLKKTLIHMIDERATSPLVVIDEAQHLSDRFLIDLSGFLNFAFDSRDLLTLWLVGLPAIVQKLRMRQHEALAARVVHQIHLEALDRETFFALVDHALRASGAMEKLLADPARELLFRATRGVPKGASKLLRAALLLAHDRNQNFVDDHVMEAALEAMPFPSAVTP